MDKREFVQSLIQDILKAKGSSIIIGDNTPLFTGGILDSVELFSLCLDIQKNFSFINSQFDFDQNLFKLDTVSQICEQINDLQTK